jgi:hypothetical protein
MAPNPDRMAINIAPETRSRVLVFMANQGYNLREQSQAINELIDVGLKAGGY